MRTLAGQFTSPTSAAGKAISTAGRTLTSTKGDFTVRLSTQASDASGRADTPNRHIQASLSHDQAARAHSQAAKALEKSDPANAQAHMESASKHLEASRVHTYAAGGGK